MESTAQMFRTRRVPKSSVSVTIDSSDDSNRPMSSNSPSLADAGEVIEASARYLGCPSGLQLTEPIAIRAIVVIGEREFFRDCLVQCLRGMYANYMVAAFATLTAWIEVRAIYPIPSIILFCPGVRLRAESDFENDIEAICRSAADIPVIVISDIEDSSCITRTIEKGARGYIPTSMGLSVAAEAVRFVKSGGTFAPFSHSKCRPKTGANSPISFTDRQIMVMDALRRGKANKQIALELNMCESTVKVHVRHIMRKLHARNRTEVAFMTASMFDEAN